MDCRELPLLLFHFHEVQSRKATIEFTVSIEGRSRQAFHAALNDLPYNAGERCGVGWKNIVIHSPDTEAFQTNSFVWYGGAAFGHITLARTRGHMDLDFSPGVETVRIVGAEATNRFEKITHESLSLPTGRYMVEATFAHLTTNRTVEVNRNQTTFVTIAPALSALHLSSNPSNALFQLRSLHSPEVSVNGSTPTLIPGLPAGEYELAVARGSYRKDLSVVLSAAKATNEVKVEFRYAKLSITSEPTDATIIEGNQTAIGKTPTSLDLQPGLYHFLLVKDGYLGTNFSLTLSETDNRVVSVSLGSHIPFAEAMLRARSQLSSPSPDFDRALADVGKALEIKPTEETALQLKREIRFNRHLRNARQFQRDGDYDKAFFEAEAAEKLGAENDQQLSVLKRDVQNIRQGAVAARFTESERGERILNHITSQMHHDELFPVEFTRFRGTVDKAREAVLRALGPKTEWTIRRNDHVFRQLVVIEAEKERIRDEVQCRAGD